MTLAKSLLSSSSHVLLGMALLAGCGETGEDTTSPTPEPSGDGITADVEGTYVGDAVVDLWPHTDYSVDVSAADEDTVMIESADLSYEVDLLDTGDGSLTSLPGADPVVKFTLGDSVTLELASEDGTSFDGDLQ